MEQRGEGGGGGEEGDYFKEKSLSFVSRNYNLLQHDDEPLDGYLGAFYCSPSSIKLYRFDPKKKRKKSWSIKKRQECVNAAGKL
jgi:hypothetical protein